MIQRFVAGCHQFVFSLHGPLYFVMVASTPEPYPALIRQLNMMHAQIVFHLTGNVAKIFEKKVRAGSGPLVCCVLCVPGTTTRTGVSSLSEERRSMD